MRHHDESARGQAPHHTHRHHEQAASTGSATIQLDSPRKHFAGCTSPKPETRRSRPGPAVHPATTPAPKIRSDKRAESCMSLSFFSCCKRSSSCPLGPPPVPSTHKIERVSFMRWPRGTARTLATALDSLPRTYRWHNSRGPGLYVHRMRPDDRKKVRRTRRNATRRGSSFVVDIVVVRTAALAPCPSFPSRRGVIIKQLPVQGLVGVHALVSQSIIGWRIGSSNALRTELARGTIPRRSVCRVLLVQLT